MAPCSPRSYTTSIKDYLTIPRLIIFCSLSSWFVHFTIDLVEFSHRKKFSKQTNDVTSLIYSNKLIDGMKYDISANIMELSIKLIFILTLNKFNTYKPTELMMIGIYYLMYCGIYSIPTYFLSLSYENKYYYLSGGNDTLEEIVSRYFQLFFADVIKIGVLCVIAKIARSRNFIHFIFSKSGSVTTIEEDEVFEMEANSKSHTWIIFFSILVVFLFITISFQPTLLLAISDGNTSSIMDSSEIEAFQKICEDSGFDVNDILICSDSYMCASPNAFFTGILEKKIFITQTLYSLMDVNLLTGVVGHELGHYKHGDIIFSYVMTVIEYLIYFLIYRYAEKNKLRSLGFKKLSIFALLVVTGLIHRFPMVFYTPIMSAIGRQFEYAADCYAAGLGLPIGESLIKLYNISANYDPHPLYTWYYEDHPHISNRITNIEKCSGKTVQRDVPLAKLVQSKSNPNLKVINMNNPMIYINALLKNKQLVFYFVAFNMIFLYITYLLM